MYMFLNGLYRVPDMPAIFQKAMAFNLIGIEFPSAILDDIIIVIKNAY